MKKKLDKKKGWKKHQQEQENFFISAQNPEERGMKYKTNKSRETENSKRRKAARGRRGNINIKQKVDATQRADDWQMGSEI